MRTGSKKYRPGEKLQQLVKAIELSLSGDEFTTVESPAHLPDRITGEPREHDVLITRSMAHRKFVTAIECKDHARPVGVNIVEAFHTKCDDTGIDKGVIVSSRGFTSNGRRKAEFFKIDCLTLEAARAHDWNFLYETINFLRKLIGGNIAVSFQGKAAEPVRIWERRPDGSSVELPNGDPQWMVDRFGDLHHGNILPGDSALGNTIHEVSVDLWPIDHIEVIDHQGQHYQPESIRLEFTYQETRSLVPMESYTYGDTTKDSQFRMTSAVLPFKDSPFDIRVIIVDHPDGSYKLTQTQVDKAL